MMLETLNALKAQIICWSKGLPMLVLVFLVVVLGAPPQHHGYKQLQGPPSSFPLHRVPKPDNHALSSKSSMAPLALSGVGVKTIPFAVDSSRGRVTIVFFSPLSSSCDFELRFPNSSVVNMAPSPTSLSLSDSGSNSAPGLSWVVEHPPTGNWSLLVSPKPGRRLEPVQDFLPNAFITVMNEGSEEEIFSHLATYDLEKDQTVGVVSRIARGSLSEVASDVRITSAVLDVITPDAKRFLMNMADDGLHTDGAANDGVFGGHFNASLSGQYKATAILSGFMPNGAPFSRSTSHLMQVVHDDVELAASGAEFDVGQDNMLTVRVPITGNSLTGTLYRGYAEIHADLIPVAWAGGFIPKQCDNKGCFVVFQVHAQWFKDANVPATFDVVLEHVTLYDKNTNIPVSQRQSMRAHRRSSRPLALVASMPRRSAHSPPFEAMLKGTRPAALRPEAVRRARATNSTIPSLVLVHGWCAQIQPWEDQPAFKNAFFFKDLDKNRPNAEFAELLARDTAHMPSFGAIGHSQGGFASTHMHNYIWTGLEASTGGRKIQSVGTPFKGSAGAGSGADLIKIFGYGCGSAFDLTVDGSALWVTGIQAETRKDVHFFHTVYADKGLIKYCNLAANTVLSWPNDGMAELSKGPLEGGNNMGVTKGECHTLGMKYDAQYRDNKRNEDMNDHASR